MIHVLPKKVADKIAAGEVVDKPVSIVKELFENAVDADASSITVEIKNGGKTYIRVSDDGHGIAKDEVQTAFLRHATSKIQTAEDLNFIATLGFRGEALASIAAVSRTEMITKTAEEKSGVCINVEGGEVSGIKGIGCQNGTSVIVRDLFYNTPARLKFMKSDGVETTRIVELISKMALAYSGIKIKMISNGSILFSTSGKNNVRANIVEIYGKETGEKLIQYYAGGDSRGEVDLQVFVSPQSQTRSNKKHQIFFVNGRCVDSKLFENAVAAAYKEKIPEGRFPVAFLFYYTNPAILDVNIHPNKKEVRFADEKAVFDFITRTVSRALETTAVMPSIVNMSPETRQEQEPEKNKDIPSFFEQKRQEMISKEEGRTYTEVQTFMLAETEDDYEKDTRRIEPYIANIQVTGVVFNTYITGYDSKYFYLIDQHAAHERVFYELLLDRFNMQDKGKQSIMTPILLEVPVYLKESENNRTEYLKELGFDIEIFGSNTYKISSIPSYMNIQEAENFLTDFIDNAGENTDFTDQKNLEKIIARACKKAVKANDKLDLTEIKGLLNDLSQTKNPYSCPHGRPVFLKLGKQEIEKMFKRI